MLSFMKVLAATQTAGETGKKWFQGTADAVRQFIWVLEVQYLLYTKSSNKFFAYILIPNV